MKIQLQTAFFLLVFFAALASAQQINPATGLPGDGKATPIDPATGLPQSDLYDEWQKAKRLMNQGQYEDSLQAFTNYFEQSRFDQGQAGQHLFSLIDWTELGRRYPKAKQALLELRDTDTQKLLDGEGDFNYFAEVNCINGDLGNGDASYKLFKAIEQRDPQLAGQCYAFVEDQLVAKGEYETCRKYMGDPESGFQSDCSRYRMEMENQARMAEVRQRMQQQMQDFNRQHPNVPPYTPPDNSQRMEKMSKDHFVGQVRQLIEILVATGDKADAEKIQKEALAILDDPRLETAVADADEKIIQQINAGGVGQTTLPAKQN
jgi:hypothetical protein